jgi:hypothetical protein
MTVDSQIKVMIRVERDGCAVQVEETIKEDPGSMEVLTSRAYAVWNATQRENAA